MVWLFLAATVVLEGWAIWLGRRPGASRDQRKLRWVLPLTALVVFFLLAVQLPPLLEAVATLNPADKATILAAGLSERVRGLGPACLVVQTGLLVILIAFSVFGATSGRGGGPPA